MLQSQWKKSQWFSTNKPAKLWGTYLKLEGKCTVRLWFMPNNWFVHQVDFVKGSVSKYDRSRIILHLCNDSETCQDYKCTLQWHRPRWCFLALIVVHYTLYCRALSWSFDQLCFLSYFRTISTDVLNHYFSTTICNQFFVDGIWFW